MDSSSLCWPSLVTQSAEFPPSPFFLVLNFKEQKMEKLSSTFNNRLGRSSQFLLFKVHFQFRSFSPIKRVSLSLKLKPQFSPLSSFYVSVCVCVYFLVVIQVCVCVRGGPPTLQSRIVRFPLPLSLSLSLRLFGGQPLMCFQSIRMSMEERREGGGVKKNLTI